ncbi:MAG: hypothetical protein AAGB26_08575 [Planctomycetota bacterium]
MEPPIQNEIKEILTQSPDLHQLRAYLLDWKARGLDQQECYEAINSFRNKSALDEETDDLILEWLDIVVGFCSPHMIVW